MYWRLKELIFLAEASKSWVWKDTVKLDVLLEYIEFTIKYIQN